MGNRKWERYGPSTYRETPVPYHRPITENPHYSTFIPYHSVPYHLPIIQEIDAGNNSYIADLPDDILVKILSYLPVVTAIRASAVCKKWFEAVKSFSRRGSTEGIITLPEKPWYFMFTSGNKLVTGFSYDASNRKWYGLDFPCFENKMWSFSSSNGLVALMDAEIVYQIFVCNPLTKDWKAISPLPSDTSTDYCAFALSVDRESKKRFQIALVKCSQAHPDSYEWELSIHRYRSETERWESNYREVLTGSRGGGECVICDRVLYYVISKCGILSTAAEPRHAVVWCDLSEPKNRTPENRLVDTVIRVPCVLTCARLMNLHEKLFLVGGIGKIDRPGIVKGIGIWEMCNNKKWKEVAKMPYKFFQGFGEFDELFASNGAGDTIYIQSYGSPALLTYDVPQKIWRWASKCPLNKKFPLQIFTGFCFEPRLDIGV